MKKEEVNKRIKEVVRPNGKGEINGNNLQETLLLMNNNAANVEDTTSKLNLKANQEETDDKLALKADKTSVYTKEEANALLDLKVNIKDYEADKEVSSKEKQELDIKLAQTKQELDNVKNSLSHMGNGVVGEAEGGNVVNLPNNAMKSVVPNYRFEGLTIQNLVKNGDFKEAFEGWTSVNYLEFINQKDGIAEFKIIQTQGASSIEQKFNFNLNDVYYIRGCIMVKYNNHVSIQGGGVEFQRIRDPETGILLTLSGVSRVETDDPLRFRHPTDTQYEVGDTLYYGNIQAYNLTQMFGAGNEPSKEWCDKYLPDYVEGTKSVQLPMRVKSVGENLFNAFGGIILRFSGIIPSKYGEELGPNKIKRWNNARATDAYGYRLYLKKGGYVLKFKVSYKGKFKGFHGFLRSENGFWVKSYSTSDVNFAIPHSGYYYLTFGCTTGDDDRGDGDRNENYVIFENIQFSEKNSSFKPYQESISYFNDKVELSSMATTKDYIENGKLYKNISDDGEILEETEVINLNKSGLIEANPNGTVFFEPITNITGFYDNGLDVEGLDVLEVEEFSHLINGVYQSLDVSKVKVEGGKLTHPDAQNGIVYLVYRYDDNAVWGENAISYYNSDKTLKSPNGKIWKKVESATDTGELVVTLEEVKEEIVEP